MLALLVDAFAPNLVQTAEGGPALVHCGPFANVAHGCSSVALNRFEGDDPEAPSRPPPGYVLSSPYAEKLETLATRFYGAGRVTLSSEARHMAERLDESHPGLPICAAKTHLSFSADPAAGGLAEGFDLPVDALEPALGAGFVVAQMGRISSMPGLPREPALRRVRVASSGHVAGLMPED